MKIKLFFVVFAFGACGCTGSSTQGDGSVEEIMVGGNKVFVCVLDKVKSGTVTIPLSSLVEDFEIVQFENSEDAFFNPYAIITVLENYISVRQRNFDSYKLFDRSGKFLCNVSKRGRGPGEFPNSLYDDIIDEKNGLIYLTNVVMDKILVYSISGHFLKDIVAPQLMYSPKMFLSDGNILTVVCSPRKFQHGSRTFDETDGMVFQFDAKTGELLEKIAPPEHLILRNIGIEILSQQNVSGVFDFVPFYFETAQYDTLYHINVKKNQIVPFYAMQYKLTQPREKPIFFQLNKNLMMTTLIKQNPAGHSDEIDLIAIDLKSKTSRRVKILNDYLGSMNALPVAYYRRFHKGYYVLCHQPEDLMEDIEARLAERTCTEADREVLKKTLSKLKEGTNNVALIGKLKDEIATKLW